MGNSSFAQKNNDLIGLSFGVSNFHITDEHTSPLIFRGTGISPFSELAAYWCQKQPLCRRLLFLMTNLSSSSDNFSTENFRGRFRYSFLHKTSDSLSVNKRLEFSFGGSVTSFYCKSDYYFDMRTIRARVNSIMVLESLNRSGSSTELFLL